MIPGFIKEYLTIRIEWIVDVRDLNMYLPVSTCTQSTNFVLIKYK